MKCNICQQNKTAFTLEVPYIENKEVIAIDEYHICGKCWEIIAEVANRRLQEEIEKLDERITELERMLTSL